MSGELRQYVPEKIVCSFAVGAPIAGFDLNDINLRPGLVRAPHITGGRRGPVWELEKDDSNNGLFSFQNDTSGTMSFSYQQDAITNRYLSILLNADQASQLGIGTLTIKDLQGTTLLVGRGCRLEGWPEVSYSVTGQVRVWTFLINDLNMFVGDHDKVG